MKNTNSIEIELLQEVSQIEYFLVKKPINTAEFWEEWQEKYGKATLTKIALKKIAKTRKLTGEEYARVKAMMGMYDEIVRYLEDLKRTALSLRGVPTNFNVEPDDEDLDFDF